MSFVEERIKGIDSQLNYIQVLGQNSALQSASEHASENQRTRELQSIIKALSTASSSRPLLSAWRLQELLQNAKLSMQRGSGASGEFDSDTSSDKESEFLGGSRKRFDLSHDRVQPLGAATGGSANAYIQELEWLLVSKATTQAYGLILNALLEQTIPLSNDIWYWDEVLGSYTFTALYTAQTSPSRLWKWSLEIYHDTRRRWDSLRGQPETQGGHVTDGWRQFYQLVQTSIHNRSMADIESRIMSPLTQCRAEARKKQAQLKRLREMSASGLGILIDEGLSLDMDEEGAATTKSGSEESGKDEWKSTVFKSVALMETVLKSVTDLETGVGDFEDAVFINVEEDSELDNRLSEEDSVSRPAILTQRLLHILSTHIPAQQIEATRLAKLHGKPSRAVRYWLPAGLLLLSSSTLLRIFFNRQTEIANFIRDIGATTRDFWYNWVVTPIKKVVGTIRHDKDSEVAIMSKESLRGDRASLERMVIDFAVDNGSSTGGPLSEADIADVRSKVREGDLTPVLKAYEKDLQKPFVGTIRGNLIRALLIQVQKTKVDVEVAVGGIDALLKSQELVFGFVGLTPGILVCLGISSWLSGVFGGRKGRIEGRKQGQMVRTLRNIDRILTACKPSDNGMLSYKDHGLLLCEVHVLRLHARKVLPGETHREFLEDSNDLIDIRTGIEKQRKVADRIRWAYSRWLR